MSFAPENEATGSQNERLWQASHARPSIGAGGRSLGQFMDLIAILGGNINGVDGDELVLEGEGEFDVQYEDEEDFIEDAILEDDFDEGEAHN